MSSLFSLSKEGPLDKLKLYKISENYIHFLREIDPINVKFNKGERRPYVGVVFTIHQLSYFAPLASPKPKHIHMKNSLDFVKIDNGKLGVINLNNMIPVVSSALLELDIEREEEKYRNILYGQIRFINHHREEICIKAKKLYLAVTEHHSYLERRCAKFKELEQKSLCYLPIDKPPISP